MRTRLSSLALSTFIALCAANLSANDVDMNQLQKDLEQLKAKTSSMEAQLESNSKSGFQLAGYAAFDFKSAQDGNAEFSGVKFAPIFHAKYGDIFQFEGEIEFTTDTAGETVIELEYAAGTIFLNDYMGLQLGKFMSPLGQFVQNQHPSWINKLPSAPLGFGHDGAAPTSYVGAALRGGLPKVAGLRHNYALFVANAPTFGQAADGDTVVAVTGKTSTNGAQLNVGGRYALNPIGGMEIGISGAYGKIAEQLTATTIIGGSVADQLINRDYAAYGADFMYNINSFDIKAEYIQQDIGENDLSQLVGGTWKAVYAQFSYQFGSVPLEPVIRYSKYSNPEAEKSQIAAGLNYLFANNLIVKIAYESTNNDTTSTTSDSVQAQLAFGF